nr:alanine racemase [Lysinibacillus timonensis]
MRKYQMSRFCWLEINLDNLRDNFMQFRQMVGHDVKIMPAIKANAYGHGIVACGKVLEECGANYLGVGSVDEGILLRENGVKMPILIFASNLVQETANLYAEYQLIPTILSVEAAKAFSDVVSKPSDIFIKIDTGRGRLGVNAEVFANLYREVSKLPNLHVEGVYSHMGAVNWPDLGPDYAMWQFSRFKSALDALGKDAEKIPFSQLANTPGSIALPEIRMSGVCPGRAMWGYSPLAQRETHPDLKAPLVSWKSRLVHVNEVIGGKFGENHASVQLEEPKRIGIMAGGLGDGISPKLAGGYVLLHGRKCPVASTLSLEHTILDLTDFPEAQVGDEIVILGRQGEEEITLEQRIKEWECSVPQIWTNISPHLDRLYYRDGRLWAVAKNERFIRIEQ